MRGAIGYTITILTKFDYTWLPYDRHVLIMLLQCNNLFMEGWGNPPPDFQCIDPPPPGAWFFDGRWVRSFSVFHGGLAAKWDTDQSMSLLQIELETDTANGIRPRWNPYSHLVVAIPFQRRPSFFFMNIVVPTFFLTGLGLISFGFDTTDLNDRLTCILTLLLSSLAFKSAISSYMPVQNHVTLLEFYVTTSFVLLSLAAFVCLGSYLVQGGFLIAERIFVAVYGVLWISTSVILLEPRFYVRSWKVVLDQAINMIQASQTSYTYAVLVRRHQ